MNLGSFRLKYPLFNKEPHYVSYQEEGAGERLSYILDSYLPEHTVQDLVLICIGTDRSTGDSLGPLIGTNLQDRGLQNFYLYGTLDEPVHALNLETTISAVTARHHNPFIIAVDACLGKSQSVGAVSIGKGPSKPGAAMNKQLPAVGNMHIHGIVNVHGFMEFFVLQNTRLSLVMKMADMIASGIALTDKRLSLMKKINHLL